MAQKKKGGKMVGKIVQNRCFRCIVYRAGRWHCRGQRADPAQRKQCAEHPGLKSGGIDNSKAKTEGINMEYSKPGFDTEEALVQDEIA